MLPVLLKPYGDLDYRRPDRADIEALAEYRVFPVMRNARSSDEIFGVYRGLRVRIAQLSLKTGPRDEDLFNGLTVEVTLANRLLGVTVVVDDGGPFGNVVGEMTQKHLQRVGLEDPVFEHAYQIYGSDQVMARALLTPTFMEALQHLAGRFGKGLPLVLARDRRLMLLLPTDKGRLFTAPDYAKPAASADTLSALRSDIRAVLRAADAVIDLDDATRRAAAPV